MIYLFLLLCIAVSAIIGVIFKYYDYFGIDTFQAIVLNYWVCVMVGWITQGSFPIQSGFWQEKWFPYAIVLGSIFIVAFNIAALTFQRFGIGFTTIIQKMSLLIPVSLGILYFDEIANIGKLTGIAFALLAIVLVNLPLRKRKLKFKDTGFFITMLPLLTFLLSGLIELIILYISKKEIAASDDTYFVSSLFAISGTLGILVLGPLWIIGKKKLRLKEVKGALVLGGFNFFSIFLLLVILDRGMEGSVLFPINNMGIVALSAVLGFFLFRERLNHYKLTGLIISIIAIALIAFT